MKGPPGVQTSAERNLGIHRTENHNLGEEKRKRVVEEEQEDCVLVSYPTSSSDDSTSTQQNNASEALHGLPGEVQMQRTNHNILLHSVLRSATPYTTLNTTTMPTTMPTITSNATTTINTTSTATVAANNSTSGTNSPPACPIQKPSSLTICTVPAGSTEEATDVPIQGSKDALAERVSSEWDAELGAGGGTDTERLATAAREERGCRIVKPQKAGTGSWSAAVVGSAATAAPHQQGQAHAQTQNKGGGAQQDGALAVVAEDSSRHCWCCCGYCCGCCGQ